MAFVSTVTKQSVEKLNEADYRITIHVLIEEDSTTVFEGDYSTRYYGQTPIGDVRTNLQNQIKADWDKYVDEQDIFDAAAFDTMVSQIESALDTYINP